MLKNTFNLLVILSLIHIPMANAKSSQPGFTSQTVTFLNGFSTTHSLLNAYAAIKSNPTSLMTAVRQELKKSSKPLPTFELTSNGEIHFVLDKQKFRMSLDTQNQVRLNGQSLSSIIAELPVDSSAYNSLFGFPLFIEAANAGFPVVAIIVGVLVGLGIACVAPGSPDWLPKGFSAKTIRVKDVKFNELLNGVRSSLCSTGACNAACAADGIYNFDYSQYFSQLCSDVAKGYSDASVVDQRFETQEKVVNPRQMRRTLFMADVAKSHARIKQKNNYENLETTDQEIIAALVSEKDFMKNCVKEFIAKPSSPISTDTPATNTPTRAQ